jgi:hypothetical protein
MAVEREHLRELPDRLLLGVDDLAGLPVVDDWRG